MTMTHIIMKDTLPIITQYLSPEDVKNLSNVNHEFRNYFTDPAVVQQIWTPFVPNFPDSMIVCQTRADLIQKGKDHFVRIVEFVSLDKRCVARLSYSKIEPESLVWAPMSGQIDTVYVTENDPTVMNTRLFLIYGMKMEMLVQAAIVGTIVKIFVTERNSVTVGSPLALIKKHQVLD